MGVGNEFVEFGEMPSVPFSASHGKGVEILVELIREGDGLDDHVVGSVDVELSSALACKKQTHLDFASRVRVTETKLGNGNISLLHTSTGKQLLLMQSNSSNQLQ